jgi:hypothetical protein
MIMDLRPKSYPWRDGIVYVLDMGSEFGEIKYGKI